MSRYVLLKTLASCVVLVVVSVLVFLLVRITPGDPAEIMAGTDATPAAVERIRHEMALDRPIWVQYWLWLTRAVRGDLGVSAATGNPVAPQLAVHFAATFELTVLAMLLATLVGIPLGVLAARRHGSALDTGIMTVAVVGQSMPVFWLALLLIYVFALLWRWVPMQGRLPVSLYVPEHTGIFLIDTLLAGDWEAFGAALRHLILPTLALATIPLAQIARMTRACTVEVLEQDYIRTARAKGQGERAILFHHALRNSLLPVITVVGINFGTLLGGAILTETIFAWPGLGRHLVEAVFKRDYPVIQGAVLLICAVFVLINYLLDIVYGRLNPKVRHS